MPPGHGAYVGCLRGPTCKLKPAIATAIAPARLPLARSTPAVLLLCQSSGMPFGGNHHGRSHQQLNGLDSGTCAGAGISGTKDGRDPGQSHRLTVQPRISMRHA